MMDPDEELNKRIKAVFDNFDDGQSDEGWAALRSSYPESNRKLSPYWWFSGIAATLLLLAGLAFWRNAADLHKNTQAVIQKPGKVNDDPHLTNTRTQEKQPQRSKYNKSSSRATPLIARTEKKKQPVYEFQGQPTALQHVSQSTAFQFPEAAGIPQETGLSSAAMLMPPVNRSEVKAATNETRSIQLINKDQLPLTVKKQSTFEFLQEQSLLASHETKETQKKIKSTQHLYEIFTGTFLNYSSKNDSKMNAGFGLNASLKVTDGLFLSVGAGFSKNNIAFNHTTEPAMPAMASDVSTLSPNKNAQLTNSSAFYDQSPQISVAKLNAQLLSLDLPVMLKFYPTKKQNFYLATGFNSNSYFAQRYDYTYDVTMRTSFSGTSQTQREETEKSDFKGFEFANSAIFAIGITQKLGKTNKLIFEPYFKPAIRQMGDKNLKINSLGMNLKFGF